MTIHFTNEEQQYVYTSKGTGYKMVVKDDAPEEIKESLKGKVKAFNDWIKLINGEKK